MLLLSAGTTVADTGMEETGGTTLIKAHFSTVEEGRKLMQNRTLFHSQIREKSLEFFLQKKEGTLEEYMDYSEDQVLPFTPEEEQRVNDALAWLQNQLERHDLLLPNPGEITFVKSTGQEASNAEGYTSGGAIFLSQFIYSPELCPEEDFRDTVIHEIFHCLSRQFPEYRQAMYSLIHFTVMDEEIDVPEMIR